jgi:hypothetical protein
MTGHPRPLGLSVDWSWSVTQRTDCSDTKAPGPLGLTARSRIPQGSAVAWYPGTGSVDEPALVLTTVDA